MIDLDAIQQRAKNLAELKAAATSAWHNYYAEKDFIAAARNTPIEQDVLALVEEVRRLRKAEAAYWQFAYESAEPITLSDERIQEIVDFATKKDTP